MLSIPWTEKTEDRIDIDYAEEILNRDHDGLEKVKERVLEYLSVRQLMNSLRGPILCLAGPPGVGKTSLARSIAESLTVNLSVYHLVVCVMNQKFVVTVVRMSVRCRDELFKG